MRVERLIIRNYAGVEAVDIKVPPGGMVIKGGNKKGKTSIVRALRAALEAEGVDPSAIRHGADRSEILVDMEAIHVRTVIRPSGYETDVMDASGEVQPKPATLLKRLFGDKLDPLSFYLAKDKDRRRMIYEAIPMAVVPADVLRWTNGKESGIPVTTGPGLEVVERFRLKYYNLRTTANAAAEASHRRAEQLRAEIPIGDHHGALPVPRAELQERAARDALSALDGRRRAHEDALKAAGPTRQRIVELRAQALAQIADTPIGGWILCPGLLDVEVTTSGEIATRVRLFEDTLAELRDTGDRLAKRERQLVEAERLEASLAGVESMRVSDQEVGAAQRAHADATAALELARKAATFYDANTAATVAVTKATKDAEEAAALDAVVQNLTKVAPKELAERSGGIPGLTLGESIALDNVPLDVLSGAEQMQFAVDLAKRVRASSKGRVIIVDGMERIDEDELKSFLAMVVKGGWQCIGTRVTRGQLSIEAVVGEEADGG